jgi:hypothetical protein
MSFAGDRVDGGGVLGGGRRVEELGGYRHESRFTKTRRLRTVQAKLRRAEAKPFLRQSEFLEMLSLFRTDSSPALCLWLGDK